MTRPACLLFLSAALGACGGDAVPASDPPPSSSDPIVEEGSVKGTGIYWKRVAGASAVTTSRPKTGRYRVELIDVGTGLSLLVRGADFTLLYDGGSGDDRSGITGSGATSKNGNRLLAYLFAALGPSGAGECAPDGDAWTKVDRPLVTIDHLFLSHPHEDHDSLLDDVLRCYHVKEVWDAGDNNNREGYAKFLDGVAATPGVVYHQGAGRHAGDVLHVFDRDVTLPRATVDMREGDSLTLGAGASLRLLHVDGGMYQDENQNSTVVRMQLGTTSMLLMGDAESGPRAAPTSPLGQIEAALAATYGHGLRADVLQVGHHGSSTSSRLALLQLVQPRVALIGVGPLPYSGVVLPDPSVIAALSSLPSKPVILRTDASDKAITACAKNGVKVDRVGLDNGTPGGCDNYALSL